MFHEIDRSLSTLLCWTGTEGTWVNRADFSAVTVQVPRISRCRRKDAQCLERNACHLSTQSPATSTKGGKWVRLCKVISREYWNKIHQTSSSARSGSQWILRSFAYGIHLRAQLWRACFVATPTEKEYSTQTTQPDLESAFSARILPTYRVHHQQLCLPALCAR